MRRVRVAIFSDALPPRLDGVAITIGRLVRELQARDHGVAVIGAGPYEDLPEAELAIRLPARPLPALPGLYGALPMLGASARRLDRFWPDVVHAVTEMPVGLAGRRYANARRIPLVTSSNTDYPAYFRHWGMGAVAPAIERWMRWFHGAAEVTLCPSRTHLDRLRERGVRSRLAIGGRGVDCDTFAPARGNPGWRRRHCPSAERIILGVGRLMPEKRFDRVIAAYAALPDPLRATTALVMVGEGPSRRTLEAKSPPGVVFAGELRGGALAEAYASSDVFVLASDEETFGNVVLEAMASGLPAIVSTRGAARELVSEETGLVVDLERPGDLADALAALLLDEPRRAGLGQGARRAAETRRWDDAVAQIVRAYRSAMQAPLGTLD